MTDEIKQFDVSNRLFCLSKVLFAGIIVFLAVHVYLDLKGLPENYPREITVSAEGKTFAKPDIALVSIGVKTEGMTVGPIVKENTEKMNAILGEIKKLGVEDKDIQTSQYDLVPQYDYPVNRDRVFKGYAMTNQLQVKIRNFDKISDILGGNNDGIAGMICNARKQIKNHPFEFRPAFRQ